MSRAPSDVTIERAGAGDVDDLAPLLEGYRAFYRRAPEPERARAFLAARLERDEAIVFLARAADGGAAGFVLLYPAFSTVRLGRLWILNDLFVDPGRRERGIGRRLMERARAHAEESGAVGLVLETEKTNRTAASLYRALGWRREDAFDRYELFLEE